MEELLQQAPEAAQYMDQVRPELQEEIADRILHLSHVDLLRTTPDLLGLTGPAHESIAPNEHTPEQALQHNRVTSMMLEAARLTGLATRHLEAQRNIPGTEGQHEFPIDIVDVFDAAQDIALQEASKAKSEGNNEAVEHAIESLLVVKLLHPNDTRMKVDITEAVASGMAADVVKVAKKLEGVVAWSGSRHDAATDIVGILRGSNGVLRVATNTDFDERFVGDRPLVPPGETDSAQRQTLVENLQSHELTALARLEANEQNIAGAAKLSVEALEGIVREATEGYGYAFEKASETIAYASRYTEQARDPELQTRFTDAMATLQKARSAGLKPYRTNISAAYPLDKALVELVIDGHIDEAKQLMSVSRHEVATKDIYGRETRWPNLDDVIENGVKLSPEEQVRVKQLIYGIHDQKLVEFRRAMEDNGVDGRTIETILWYAPNPDEAALVSPEFWKRYYEIQGITPSPDPAAPYQEPKDGQMLRILIEGEQAHNIDKNAQAILTLLDAGLAPSEIDARVLDKLRAFTDTTKQAIYLEQLAESAQFLQAYAKSEQSKTDYGFRQREALDTLAFFSEPKTALQLAQKLYGEKAFSYLTHVKALFGTKTWNGKEDTIDLDPKAVELATFLAERAPIFISNPEVFKACLKSIGLETMQRLLHVAGQSPVLQKVIAEANPFLILEGLLDMQSSTVDAIAQRAALFETAFSGNLEKVYESYQGMPSAQSAIINRLMSRMKTAETNSLKAESANLVAVFEESGLRQVLLDHPYDMQHMLQVISRSNYDIDYVKGLVAAFNSDNMAGLTENLERGGITKETYDSFVRQIIDADNPHQLLADIIGVYSKLSFIQERIPVDFAPHFTEWKSFAELIPDGPAGIRMREQALARLRLRTHEFYGQAIEDPIQAIRIFHEVVPDADSPKVIREQSISLIEALIAAESTRGFPSTKPTKLKEVFLDEDLQELYIQVFGLKQSGDIEGMERVLTERDLSYRPLQGQLSEVINGLKQRVRQLHDQERAAVLWLKQFSGQDIKAVKLIEAWKSREQALAYGIKDNPKDILQFVAEKGVQLLYDKRASEGTTDIRPEEFEIEQPFIQAMGIRYSPEVVFSALERRVNYRRENGRYPTKLVGPAKASITLQQEEFTAEMLDVNDPRGFTIGYDTGCCMTLRGASESCIWAGYEDPRYSFFAVYDPNGKLRAQSIMYLAEADGEQILVADNIEATAGTDISKIAEVYTKALVQFIEAQSLDISAIQVGKGYTPAAIINTLPDASVSPATPRAGTYTDAYRQKVLWRQPKATPTSGE